MPHAPATSLPADPQCWHAVCENDRAYDGRFVYAVQTTGIYCRPSCPSRTPKRAHVQFYALPALAEADGFRACKRCQPQRIAPQDETAGRIADLCAYIAEHLHRALTLEHLATVAHWSPYHLQRVFKMYTGISPRQYTEAQRMRRFKQHLRDDQTVTEALYAAGYHSPGQVYPKTDAHLGMTPTTYQENGATMDITYTIVASPLGRLLVAMTERGVCAIKMGTDDTHLREALRADFSEATLHDDATGLAAAVEAILAYLNGEEPHMALPLDVRVTAFQQRVLEELQRIPYGETRSYGEVARAIGKPNASQAVGQACGRNPVPLLIPCHRVISSDGTLGGFSAGLDRKRQLLSLEGHPVTPRLIDTD